MLRNLRLVWLYFKVNLAGALAYRSAFVMQAAGMALSNAAFIFFWWIAFAQIGGRIGGYDFSDVMFIWAMASTSFGLASVFLGNFNGVSGTIVSGELDVYLLQPKPVIIGLLCNRTSLSAWGDVAYGFILMALTRQSGAAWLVFLPGVVAGALVTAAIGLCGHTLTFFFGEASLIGRAAVEFSINFCIYPQGIYRGLVRLLMYTLIPAAFVVHVPLSLARSFTWTHLIGLACGICVYLLLVYRFFLYGLRRYESGNLILTRQ